MIAHCSRFTIAAYGQVLVVHAANAALSGTSESAFKSNLGYSGEQWDASLRMQNLRARAYDPRNGRFIGLDPFAGNRQDPQTLHKYAYVHGDPIQGIDPNGLFTISGMLSGFSISTVNRAASNASSLKTLHTASKVIDFLEFAHSFVYLFTSLRSSGIVLQHLRELFQMNSPGHTGQDWIKFTGLNESHFTGVVTSIISHGAEILSNVVSEHRRLLTNVFRSAANRNSQARPRLVVTLPSLPGNWTGGTLFSLPKSVEIAGMRVQVMVPKTGGGSLFAIGFKFPNSSKVHQVFRVDYHGQSNPEFTLKYGSNERKIAHGYARSLPGTSATDPGIGDSIPGIGKPKFHYHVPFSEY